MAQGQDEKGEARAGAWPLQALCPVRVRGCPGRGPGSAHGLHPVFSRARHAAGPSAAGERRLLPTGQSTGRRQEKSGERAEVAQYELRKQKFSDAGNWFWDPGYLGLGIQCASDIGICGPKLLVGASQKQNQQRGGRGLFQQASDVIVPGRCTPIPKRPIKTFQ